MSLKSIPPEDLNFSEAKVPQIRVESWSNSARTLQVRGFCKDALISHDHVTNSDRSVNTTTFDVPDIPMSLQVSPSAGPVRRGECYVRLTLLMGGFPVARLVAAYLTDGKTLTWPPGVHENFTDGKGLIRVITGTDPAAGAEVSETVPTNVRWLIRAIYLFLVTDATVANRCVTLYLDDGTNAFTRIPDPVNHAASENRTYSYCLHGVLINGTCSGWVHELNLPDIPLFQGYRFRTGTSNLQAGDDYAAPVYVVEEWIEE